MAKFLLLCFVILVLAGSAASAAPVAAQAPLFAVAQADPAAALQCMAEVPNVLLQLENKLVPICAGDGCAKTSDCRPPGLPECANCWCLGPAGDKSCACF